VPRALEEIVRLRRRTPTCPALETRRLCPGRSHRRTPNTRPSGLVSAVPRRPPEAQSRLRFAQRLRFDVSGRVPGLARKNPSEEAGSFDCRADASRTDHPASRLIVLLCLHEVP
jgi:hypothetical protein